MIYAGGTGLTVISEITELGKIKVAESCLTSSILLAEIRKSPDVSQSDAESENRQEKLGWTVPLLALLQNKIKEKVKIFLLTFNPHKMSNLSFLI